MSTSMPYPGLRPFRGDETDIFFGREEQADELLEKLEGSRFLAVVGPSGCGKSSLVRAGMITALEAGFMASAGAFWRVADMRPGSHPLKRLAAALFDALEGAWGEKTEDAVALLHATLRRGPLGLIEVLRDTPLPPQTNLLLLVDQFEEIFRYRERVDRDEADAFVAMLLDTASQREIPVYVVITMRSDFLGDCAVFPGLPAALNESQFLTPRLTREQSREAIVGPARVFGGDADPDFVNCLLNDMGSSPDQLPLMQHLLMRIWTHKQRETSTRFQHDGPSVEMQAKADGFRFTLADYEAAGGLAKALSNHADEVFEQLNDEQQKIGEVLFRCLSERGPEKRDTRRPVPLEVVAAVAGAPTGRVKEVVEAFRHPDCSFVTPAAGEPLYPNTVLDISHESLIRQWERLNEWVELEAKSAENYRFLEQTALLWKKRRAALWGTPNLENALAWKEMEKPTPTWAERYGGNFELAMDFLDASDRKRRDREAEEEAKRKQELAQAKALAEAQEKRAEAERQRAEKEAANVVRMRRMVTALVLGGLIACGAAIFAVYLS
ncbi:MAG: AAA family ATPase, partial [Desulfobacterales bacterium]